MPVVRLKGQPDLVARTGDFLSFIWTGTAMSYPLYLSSVVRRAAEDNSLLNEFRSENVSGRLLDEFMRLFFSNSNLTVNLYPLIILAASIGLVLLLTFLTAADGTNFARVEQGYTSPLVQQGYGHGQGQGYPQQLQGEQSFNGATGLPLALAGYGYIVPVLNQNVHNQNGYNQPFVNVGYSS